SLSLFYPPIRRPQTATLFPYTTLFRSAHLVAQVERTVELPRLPTKVHVADPAGVARLAMVIWAEPPSPFRPMFHRLGVSTGPVRSEEHTSELHSRENLVCRLLLEKKKN